MKLKRILSVLMSGALLTTCVSLQTVNVSADAAENVSIETFSMSDVTMKDAYTVNAFEKEIAYLLSFENDRLLVGFRENAKMNTFGKKRYECWESTLIGGHTVGHYMTAMAQAYINPLATAAQKDEILSRLKGLIDGMRECQKNSKGKPGFLWAAVVKNANNVEQEFDFVEQGKTNIVNEAWVPWYTMHKLIAGLVDVYKNTGYEPAKEVASDLGDWTYNRCSKWNEQLNKKVLSVEYGGMNDCLYELYAITGKDNHAIAAHHFDETDLHEAVLKGGANVLNNKHANTTIPKFVGALKRYMIVNGKTIGGQKVDASKYLEYAKAFWQMVTTHHTYITGGNSEWEHFGMDDILDKERTNCNCETCNTYNMLKLSRALFQITGDVKYMDFYENAYYNSILSSQNPETGMTTYFQPMATGYFKVYSSPFGHFWCCTGSGMENFTKLGDTMYMHKGNTLYVNYYQSSVLNWKEKSVTVTQDSTIPNGNTTKFTIDGSGELEFRFRIPDWKADNIKIKLNGSAYSYKEEDSYAVVSGSFKTGDVIELTIPMAVKAYSLPDNANSFGFKYGPIVLSAELGTANMQNTTTGWNVTIPKDKVVANEKIKINASAGTVKTFMHHINEHLVKDSDSLKFKLKDTDANLTFTPHYLQYKQRYGIYWYFNSAENAVEEEIPRSKETVVDTVQPGYGQYENDELHNMDEVNTTGVTDDSTYRYAENGGHFTYRMAVDKEAPITMLQVTFRKSDNGKPIRITAGDRVLYQTTLGYSGNTDTYNVKLIIPNEVLNENVRTVSANGTEYNVIDIGFSSGSDKESAKVCDFIYTISVKPEYEYDSSVAYLVDCGDHDVTTSSKGDKLGIYNSVSEQLYGADKVTGMKWGLVDDPTDQYKGGSKSRGIYTANTWPDESNTQDGRDKSASFRYTKNQYEHNIDRHLDYTFDLPDGKYNIGFGFANPWNCSAKPTLTAEDGNGDKTVLVREANLSQSMTYKESVVVKGGTLKLHFTSDDKAINVTYIKISFDELEPLPLAKVKGDVDSDGKFDVSDAVLLRKWLLSVPDTKLADPKAADMNSDDKLDIIDFLMMKMMLVSKTA